MLALDGTFNQQIITSIVTTLRDKLGRRNHSDTVINDVCHVFVELMQNTIRHNWRFPSPGTKDGTPDGATAPEPADERLVIGGVSVSSGDDGTVRLETKSYLPTKEAGDLVQLVTDLTEQPIEVLEEDFFNRMIGSKQTSDTPSRGGMGLIDVVLRTGKRVQPVVGDEIGGLVQVCMKTEVG